MKNLLVVVLLGASTSCVTETAESTSEIAATITEIAPPVAGGPALPACVVTDATRTPISVGLPPGFPQALQVINSMSNWLAARCAIALPGSRVVADDVTCELGTQMKNPMATGMASNGVGIELDQKKQTIKVKKTFRNAAGTVLGVDITDNAPAAPTTAINCDVTCAGTLDGTLTTAQVVRESANNPAGILPPGFCAELQTRLAQNQVDCALTSQSTWKHTIALTDLAAWTKGAVTIESYPGSRPNPADLVKYSTAATVDTDFTVQVWNYDRVANDATCANKVTPQQQTTACTGSVPATLKAKYTVGGGVCIAAQNGGMGQMNDEAHPE